MDLTAIAAQWAATLPPFVAGIDYAFCKGRTPGSGSTRRGCQRRPGAFGVAVREGLLVTRGTIRLMDVIDGTSSTIAIGEAAGSSQRYPIRDLDNPGQSARSAHRPAGDHGTIVGCHWLYRPRPTPGIRACLRSLPSSDCHPTRATSR